jgi:hypothetical protein
MKIASDDTILLEESWEERLYQSDFWRQLTTFVEKFIHKILTIEYIQ